MPELMQDMQVLQSSPIHSITQVVVHLDPDPNGKDVYEDKGVLIIAKPGFMKLLSAAGMEEIPEQCQTELREDGVFYAKEVIKWTQPDGKDIVLSGDKLMDLRIGGARWDKAYESALDRELQDWGKKNSVPKKSDESYATWADRVAMHLETTEGRQETLRLLTLLAKKKANREMRQKAQFGAELAQTGAIERAVKAQLGLKSSYTKAELEEGFVIFRSEFRWDMIEKIPGGKKMLQAYTAKALGLTREDMALLESGPAIVQPEGPEVEDPFAEAEGKEAEETERDPLYDTPVKPATAAHVKSAMELYHGWAGFKRSKACEITGWIFSGKMFDDLSQAEMLLLRTMYEKLNMAKRADAPGPERHEMAKDLKAQIDQCITEGRMWRESKEEATQSELPGMPEKEADDPDQEGESSEPGTTDDSDS